MNFLRIILAILISFLQSTYAISSRTNLLLMEEEKTNQEQLNPKAITASNVLLLLADDAGFETSAYLNRFCQTPNLNNFAKQSVIFNNAFTSVSSCSPSRAQIFTGKPSHQNGMYGLHHDVHHFNVFDNIESLPNILRDYTSNSDGKKKILTGIIGKKHIGPKFNFNFEYEQTEENHSINQIGRNITKIRNYVREFFDIFQKLNVNEKKFLLVISFHDPHRCGHITPEYGEFCEKWGSGEINMGEIPDWKPIYYDWINLKPLPYMQDTDKARQELAAQYQTISRLDQGIGLILNELKNTPINDKNENKSNLRLIDETLIIYTSDNGPPFPGGRTNLYDPGVREPMIIYSPDQNARRNSVSYSMVSLLDIFPTVLDVFGLKSNISSLGKSLLPLLIEEPKLNLTEAIFGSQNFHEITMNYPMRMIRTHEFKLIHNLNYHGFFPIDQDLYTSLTFQELLNYTKENHPLPWFKRNLNEYYIRREWEMYDLKMDPLEQWNIAEKSKFQKIRQNLEKLLFDWQKTTNDPWLCAPHGVLEGKGSQRECFTLGHEYMKINRTENINKRNEKMRKHF